MSFLSKFFGRKKSRDQHKQSEGSPPRPIPESDQVTKIEQAKVSSCRTWKCPNCGATLKKPLLGELLHPGEHATIAGTGTCGECLSRFATVDIYGGKYDTNRPNTIKS